MRLFAYFLKHDALSLAEHALSDSLVKGGARISLQRRILRLAKPPRRWKVPFFPDFPRKDPIVSIFHSSKLAD